MSMEQTTEPREIALAHAAAMGPSATAQGIAYSAIAVAQSDLLKACEQIRVHKNNNEALAILEEAKQQIECAERMLSGTVWML